MYLLRSKNCPCENIPSGENRASVLNVLKKCRFRQSETTDSFPKIGLKFPGELKCFFDDVL